MVQDVHLTCLVFFFLKLEGHRLETLILFKTKHLHQKPHRQQVSVLTRHVMLTCQSFSKQSGENKHTRCKDVKQIEYIPQPLQLLPSPHSRSNFKCIKPGGEQRDLKLGRIWTTENKVKEVYYPSSHIWKNRGILEVKKTGRTHLLCHDHSDQQEPTVGFCNAFC